MPAQPDVVRIEPTPPGVAQKEAPHRSPWVLLLSLALAAVLLYLTLRGLDWAAFWSTIGSGHYEFLLLTVPIASVNYLIRAVRWSIFVRTQGRVPVLQVFWANMVGYMGNAYLPARAGELLRSAFLGRKTGLGTSFVLATALAERLLDVIALVLIGSASLLMQAGLPPSLTTALRAVALVGILGLVVAVAAPFHERRILRIVSWIPVPERFARPLSQQVSRFLLGMRTIANGRRLVSFGLLTLAIWLIDAFANTVGVRVISQQLSLSQALILLSALGLSSAIPSTPGYVGVYQFVAITVLVPFGFSRPEALAYILMSQILNYLLVTLWGLLGLWQVNGKG